MSLSKKASIFTLFCTALFILSAIAISFFNTSVSPLFYYATNAFFVSLCVFALPSCFYLLFNAAKISDILSFKNPLNILLAYFAGFFMYCAFFLCGNVFLSLTQITLSPPYRPEISFISILTICIIPAISEELFFRGILLYSWRSFGRIKTVLLTAFLFSFMHIDASSFVPLFLLGILLSDMAYKTKSILPSTAFHASYNLAWLVMPTTFNMHILLIILFTFSAFLLSTFCIVFIYKHSAIKSTEKFFIY